MSRKWSLLPESVTPDGRRLLMARAMRGFADGVVSVLLASYLSGIGFSAFQISAVVTGTLLGSAALTLLVGLAGWRFSRRRILLAACGVMAATGLGFFGVTAFWPLLLIAVCGTLNPSAGDVSVFLPLEQSLVSEAVSAEDRTALFARYNLMGRFAGAFGALASGLPVIVAERQGWEVTAAQRTGFILYAAVAVGVAFIYWGMTSRSDRATGPVTRAQPLRESRAIVLRLSALFSLDSLSGGLVVDSLLVLWLFRRYGLSEEAAGTVFFAGGLLAGFSQLAASRLARRIGLVNTMVYTHLPSSVLLILAALMPTAGAAVALLLCRMALSQMDVPARQSYVMGVVPPEERAAAASVTNVPRSLASALTPLLAGALLERTSFGWPLILCGLGKITYDLLLLAMFRHHPPREEAERVAAARAG